MTHTSTEPRNKLLPCPFCGARARFEIDDECWEWVECSGCGIQGNRSASLMEDCKPKLAEAWNIRAPAAPVPLRKPTLDKVAEAVGYHASAWGCVDPSELIDAILMLAAAPQPPDAASTPSAYRADVHKGECIDEHCPGCCEPAAAPDFEKLTADVLAKQAEPTPVQMPEPVAVAFRFETEEYGYTATSFYPSDRIGMGWTALYTEHQVRQLLATQEPST